MDKGAMQSMSDRVQKKEQCLARNEHGAIAFYAYAVLNLEDEPELHQPGGPNILKSVAPSTNIVF
jgi:hypothetical protein